MLNFFVSFNFYIQLFNNLLNHVQYQSNSIKYIIYR